MSAVSEHSEDGALMGRRRRRGGMGERMEVPIVSFKHSQQCEESRGRRARKHAGPVGQEAAGAEKNWAAEDELLHR